MDTENSIREFKDLLEALDTKLTAVKDEIENSITDFENKLNENGVYRFDIGGSIAEYVDNDEEDPPEDVEDMIETMCRDKYDYFEWML